MNLKIKIMKRLPDVTDEEIKSYMDFDKVLQKRNSIVKTSNFLKAGLAVSGVALISALLYLYYPKQISSTQSVLVVTETVTEAPVQLPQDGGVEEQTDEIVRIQKEESVEEQQSKDADNPVKKSVNELPQVPESHYIQAEPVNGYDALFAYFRNNLSYPTEAITDSVQGILTVSFVINKEGKPQGIEFQKSLGEPFEREALKLIQQMPPWKPASLNGKPVNSRISLPLTFELIKR